MKEFEITMAERMADVPDGPWDALTENASLFLRRPYLATLEQAGPDTIQHRYVMFFRRQNPVAAASLQILSITGKQMVEAAPPPSVMGAGPCECALGTRLIQSARNAGLHVMGGRVAVCGNFFSTGPHGAAFAPEADPRIMWPVLGELLCGPMMRANPSGTVGYAMVKDVPEVELDTNALLRRLHYRRLETEPDMVLRILPHWRRMEEYLQELKAKYRKSAHTIFRAFDESGNELERLENLNAHADTLYALYKAVESRAKVSLASFPEGYLPALAKALGPDHFRCTVARRKDKILGFMTTLRDGDTAIAHYAGLDYEANAAAPVYLRLLYTVISDALEWQCRRISFGRTALDAKARLGAQPAPLVTWLRHRNPVANVAVGALVRLVPHETAPPRHPMKQPEIE